MSWNKCFRTLILGCFLLNYSVAYSADGVFKQWLQGDVDKAFKQSQVTSKPVLLYWGAVWCPPCNDLKERVFSSTRFQELLDLVVPVYLDGDSENAQVWGDKLKASGYPTVLLLNKDGKELLRIVESLDSREFEDALRSSLSTEESHFELLQQITKRQPSLQEWKKLAYARWETRDLNEDQTLQIIDGLAAANIAAEKLPVGIKQRLAANLVDIYLQSSKEEKFESIKKHETLITRLIENLTKPDSSSAYAARDFILYSVKDVLEWSHKKLNPGQMQKLVKNWESSARVIEKDSTASTETRLWAIWPQMHLEAWKKHPGKKADLKKLSWGLNKKVKQRVAWADKVSKTLQQRQAVISGGAYLLRKIGDHQTAIEMLLRESSKSTSPWYYYSSLSAVYRELEQFESSLAWAIRATESAKGRATKIQWLTSEILLRLSPELAPTHRNKLPVKLDRLYGLVFGFADGFSGRNATRLKRVAARLGDKKELSAELIEVLSKTQKRCTTLAEKNRELCIEHFSFLKPKKQNLKG